MLLGLSLVAATRCALWMWAAFHPPACLETADHHLVVQLLAVKTGGSGVSLLDAKILDVLTPNCHMLRAERIRLSWYFPDEGVQAGDILRAEVRLRKPWGAKNPGGFDYGLWLLGQGYRASGYLRAVHASNVERRALRPKLRIPATRYVYGSLLNALALGVRDGVSDQSWALFRETGTIHLMVVSGLHVGVFAGFIYLLAGFAFRLLTTLPPPWHAHNAASMMSLLGVALLVYQTGMQAPVLRAALMVGVVIVLLMCARTAQWWRVILLVALVCVVLLPRMVLQQGFWLSYAAVAVLLFFFGQRYPRQTWVRGFVSCQAVLLVGLTPWLGVTAGEVPLISPIANLLVVPLMSLLTIPLAMAGALLLNIVPALGHLLLSIADISLAPVMYLLESLRDQLGSSGYFAARAALQGMLAGIVLMLPVSWKLRGVALLISLSLFLSKPVLLPHGEFRVTVLDVGQGSAALVDTARHRLVVDTGPAFRSGFDTGASVVIPALRSTGPDRLDRILISHADNDHAGGAAAVAARYPTARLIGLGAACPDGLRWQWEGVDFAVLSDRTARTRNDASCTLLVSNPRRSVYFSGDIGQRVERRLLPRLPSGVDLLLAPHHGSTTSSSPRFVHHLCPRMVVYPAGRLNRFGHPRPEVVARYQRIGAVAATTGLDGAVMWRSDRPARLQTWRRGVLLANSESGSCRQPRSYGGSR